MDQNNHFSPPMISVEITDVEHALILMMRSMSLDQIICVMMLNNFLPKELPNKFNHIVNIINLYFMKCYEIHTIKTLIEFISTHSVYSQLFQQHSLSDMMQKYKVNNIAESEGVNELYLKPYTTECIRCKKQLKATFSHRSKTIMSLARTYKALVSTCVCQDCNIRIFPNFYIDNNKKIFTVESIKNDQYVYLNGNQIFEQNLLIDFDHQLIQNTVSFEGYTNAYNAKIKMILERQNGQRSMTYLNEKNFQMTWLLVNIVKFSFMTTNDKSIAIPMSVRDVDECNDYFLMIKSDLYEKFVKFWTRHQRFTKTCDPATCSRVFIVDGHQKANRLICQHKDIFDNTIPELGPVQMGCLYSPLRKASNIDHRFCQHHQPSKVLSSAMCHMIHENRETDLDKLALAQFIDKDGRFNDELCNVFRSGINNKSKISSYGFLATFLNCSVIVGFTEQPCAEGMRRVLHHVLTIMRFGPLPAAMCYDCACTLKLFVDKHFGSDNLKSTNFTAFLPSLPMAIDRFHVKNHKRAMCKTIMRPDHECHKGVYNAINTQVAEQGFSYLSKFKNSFRGYNYPKSTIFFTILFHLKNCAVTGISSFEQSV
ncbi:unnamed protein product [Adineta ricciae]|uniref:CxC5 like cysteine cluster associated with KDZ domain-containing protein n=1 Tax=Adineta ricciae TaxID=249248 RepID=A0A815R0T8_ADIRI|nr:unnamed protein product [Adineta ricciae]